MTPRQTLRWLPFLALLLGIVLARPVMAQGTTSASAEALPALYLAPLDEPSLAVLGRLCDIIREAGDGLPYGDVRLFVDPEGRMLGVVNRVEKQAERSSQAQTDAARTSEAYLRLDQTTRCRPDAARAAEPPRDFAKAPPPSKKSGTVPQPQQPPARTPYETLWVKSVGTRFYRMRVTATADPQTNQPSWRAEGWSELPGNGDPSGTARALGWTSLPIGGTKPFHAKVDVEGPRVTCRGSARLLCFPIGGELSAIVTLTGSAWIAPEDLAWSLVMRCTSRLPARQDDRWQPPSREREVFSFSGSASLAQARQGGAAGASQLVRRVALRWLWADDCRLIVTAWSPVGSWFELADSPYFQLQAMGIAHDETNGLEGKRRVRLTRVHFDLKERSLLLGVGRERTNHGELDSRVWWMSAVSGAEIERIAAEFIQQIEQIEVAKGYEHVVAKVVDDFVGSRGHTVGAEIFSPEPCEEMFGPIEEYRHSIGGVTNFPTTWRYTCNGIASILANGAVSQGLHGVRVSAHGTAPATAIPAASAQASGYIRVDEQIFADKVDVPFGRTELYDARAQLPNGELTEPVAWSVHQTAAPVDVRAGLSAGGGLAILWRRRLDGTYYLPRDIQFDGVPAYGFTIAVAIARDLLALRVSPTWMRKENIREVSVPLALEVNLACWRPDESTGGVHCDKRAIRALAGYDLNLKAVSFGAQVDWGIHPIDALEIRPGLSGNLDVLLFHPPQEGFTGVLATIQAQLAITLLDPTPILY